MCTRDDSHTMNPRRYIPILPALAIFGVGVELWLQRPVPGVAEENPRVSETALPAKDVTNSNSELAQLRVLLQQEIQKREQLQQRVQQLEQRVSQLETAATNTEKTTPHAKTNPGHETSNTPKDFIRGPGFNSDAMLASGIAPEQVKRIQQVYDDVEMQKLYLRDQAVREGWIGQPRYNEARKELDQRLETLRSELSDTDYSAYLYATGQSNQVIIESTMNTSPAQNAGMQAGDIIIRYNNQPVYSWSDLRSASTQCTAETSVGVEIKRAGTLQHLYIPCGPLGVRIITRSERP